ncbi:MAG: hypothetical protein HYZ83_07695 [Candidatus Omnitrophica bacterium]|nr:hypothetical protein [Candidatus Omnitrophota bacterium]
MGRRFEFAKAFFFSLPLFLILSFTAHSETEETKPDPASSPVPIAEVTERMHSLAQKLNHMPEPPELGAIQLPIIDIPKRNPAKTEEN